MNVLEHRKPQCVMTRRRHLWRVPVYC